MGRTVICCTEWDKTFGTHVSAQPQQSCGRGGVWTQPDKGGASSVDSTHLRIYEIRREDDPDATMDLDIFHILSHTIRVLFFSGPIESITLDCVHHLGINCMITYEPFIVKLSRWDIIMGNQEIRDYLVSVVGRDCLWSLIVIDVEDEEAILADDFLSI